MKKLIMLVVALSLLVGCGTQTAREEAVAVETIEDSTTVQKAPTDGLVFVLAGFGVATICLFSALE
jgi:uncharacterized protein YcfL